MTLGACVTGFEIMQPRVMLLEGIQEIFKSGGGLAKGPLLQLINDSFGRWPPLVPF